MGLLRKLLGPSLNELVAQEIEAKKRMQQKKCKEEEIPYLNKENNQINVYQNNNDLLLSKTEQYSNKENDQITANQNNDDSLLSKIEYFKRNRQLYPECIEHYFINHQYIYPNVQLKVIPDNLILSDELLNNVDLSLIPEPTNQYDENAIVVMINNIKLGYIPKSRIQSMIHDYQKKKRPIYARLWNFEFDSTTKLLTNIEIFLGFYFNPADYEKYDKISTKLIKTNKKDEYDGNRQDNIIYAAVDDYVRLEYDMDTESYIVTLNETELGETNAKVTDQLLQYNEDCFYLGKITNIEENESGTLSVSMQVYLKDC